MTSLIIIISLQQLISFQRSEDEADVARSQFLKDTLL